MLHVMVADIHCISVLTVPNFVLIQGEFAPGFVYYKNGALDSQPKVIKFTRCLPMVSGSLWVLRLLPPLILVAMI
jgi:hypothetical protein